MRARAIFFLDACKTYELTWAIRLASEKSRKPKTEAPASGDEGEVPKRKRRGKIKKANGEQGEGDEGGIFSDDEEVEKPARKVHNFAIIILGFSTHILCFCLASEEKGCQGRGR